MPFRSREDALSEVIGFILILALIAALASLYLTYVVPAQGREGEIKHMATINDQFLGYKTAIDSLWINDQTNVPISKTFTLGTLTGTTQGSFVIPIFQPYPSSGSIVVNGRGESISIQADVLMDDYSGSAILDPGIKYYSEPEHLYIKVRSTDLPQGGGINITPNPGVWTIWLNTTLINIPESTTSGPTGDFPIPNHAPDNTPVKWDEFRPWINNLKTWIFDTGIGTSPTPCLTMSIFKYGNPIFVNFTIVNNMVANEWYTVDILDEAYGINNEKIEPFTLSITATENWESESFGYKVSPIDQSHLMGSLQFNSNNKYWIQQNYYYQQGGVFLEQPGEGMVAKVMPLISVTNQTGIPTVRIIDFSISGTGNIGGTSPVQVISRLDSVSHNNINGYALARGIPNAKNVFLTLNLHDTATAQMWNQTFAAIRNSAGDEIQNWITGTQTGNQATLSVKNPSPGSSYDIILDYSRVNLSVELQPVAV